MRCWKNISALLVCAALAACAGRGEDAQLRIRSAAIERGVLTARLQWRPSAAVLDALDHGIVLAFTVDVHAYGAEHLGWRSARGHVERHIELRYFPLSRRYQLRDLDRGETRSFAARALLLAALEDLRLDLPPGWIEGGAGSFALSIDLDRDQLPGALRLPALLRPEWRVSSGEYSWQNASAG